MNSKSKNIIIACGGTGGHIYPGLATAHVLQQRGHNVTLWLSGQRDVEKHVASNNSIKIFHTRAVPFNVKNAFKFCASFFRCIRAMRAAKPDVLLAMGSYSSLPPVASARFCHVPVVLHEANARPGRAVEFLARFARKIALTYPESAKEFPKEKTVLTGLPIRTTQLKRKLEGECPHEPLEGECPHEPQFTVFVTGGSQGALRVNQLASEAFALMQKQGFKNLCVIHQTGVLDEKPMTAFYAQNKINARVSAFIQDMGAVYAEADLVIARAGAATCAELAYCGIPTIFIPLPSATRDHQTANAQNFVDAGAALRVAQNETTPESLAQLLTGLFNDPARLQTMRGKSLALATTDAAEKLAAVVESLINPHSALQNPNVA